MDEFLKINWGARDLSLLEDQLNFAPEEAIANLYVYKNFSNPIVAEKQEICGAVGKDTKITDGKYVPGKSKYCLVTKRSLLNMKMKRHCLEAMKAYQMGKTSEMMTLGEKHSFKMYLSCQATILEENKSFAEFVRDRWNSRPFLPIPLPPLAYRHARCKWNRNCKRYLDNARFYKQLALLSLTFEESLDEVVYENTATLLELGTLAKLSIPTLKAPCKLEDLSLPPPDTHLLDSKLDVSRDKNVEKLLETHQIDVVTSMSGLKRLFYASDVQEKWFIPIKIKNVVVKNHDGQTVNKKVVFIDKPLPRTDPALLNFKNSVAKSLLKSNFCQHEAFSFPDQENPIVIEDASESSEEQPSVPEVFKRLKNLKGTVHHNVSYRLWKIRKTCGQQNTLMKNKGKNTEINVLVRCKTDACQITDQGALQPVVLMPKIEYQLQYGATVPTKKELIKAWTSLFFRPYSTLYRVRLLDARMLEVIAFDKCSLQRLNTEAASFYSYKPSAGLGVVQRILEELTSLDVGDYLLQHLPKHGSFVSIMKKSDESVPNVFDLHKEYKERGIVREPSKRDWLPIDVNYILPAHEYYGDVPGTFAGNDYNKVWKTNYVKKGKGKKKKKKKKNNNMEDEKNEAL